jgi:WD40 repeat protein
VAYGGFVQLWDTSDPAHMARVGPPIASPGGAALSLSFSPDGRSLAIGGAAHQLQLWDVSTPTHPVLRGSDTFGPPR